MKKIVGLLSMFVFVFMVVGCSSSEVSKEPSEKAMIDALKEARENTQIAKRQESKTEDERIQEIIDDVKNGNRIRKSVIESEDFTQAVLTASQEANEAKDRIKAVEWYKVRGYLNDLIVPPSNLHMSKRDYTTRLSLYMDGVVVDMVEDGQPSTDIRSWIYKELENMPESADMPRLENSLVSQLFAWTLKENGSEAAIEVLKENPGVLNGDEVIRIANGVLDDDAADKFINVDMVAAITGNLNLLGSSYN